MADEPIDLAEAREQTLEMIRKEYRLTLAIYAQATSEGDRSAASKLGARLMGSASGSDDSASSTPSSS